MLWTFAQQQAKSVNNLQQLERQAQKAQEAGSKGSKGMLRGQAQAGMGAMSNV